MPRKHDSEDETYAEAVEEPYVEQISEPEDEFARPVEPALNEAALARHSPEAARPQAVKVPVAPNNEHRHGDHDMPSELFSPPLPENRKPLRDPGPFDSVPAIEEDPTLLQAVQDPYNERNPRNQPKMVVTRNSYGDKVLMPL